MAVSAILREIGAVNALPEAVTAKTARDRRGEISFVGSSLPEFTRVTLQEVDDLVAHRAVLVGLIGAGGEKQLPRAAEARLKLRMREQDFPVRFGAFTADN
jgi:hypothetical protein